MNLQSNRRILKIISVCLSAAITANVCCMMRTDIFSMSEKAMRRELIDNAISYLISSENSDGSYGDNRLVNDTSFALYALRKTGETSFEDSEKWLTETSSAMNTDIVARISASTANPLFLSDIAEYQNDDGGFGLNKNYASDVLDSALVLDAVIESGYSDRNIMPDKLYAYLINSANPDGGYSYNNVNRSDDLLTAAVVLTLEKYLEINSMDKSVLNKSVNYLSSIKNDFSDNAIEKTICKNLALIKCREEVDCYDVISGLHNAEKEDGSFAGSVRITSYALLLANELTAENQISVSDFNTVIECGKATTAKSAHLTGKTDIEYSVSEDTTAELKFTVYNSEETIYINSQNLELSASEQKISVDSADFILAVPDNQGVYAVVELYSNDKLIKSQNYELSVSDSQTVYSTEISNLNISLDSRTLFKGSGKSVNISYDLLYATNIEQTAELYTIITRDGKEIHSENTSVLLVPEQNSVSDIITSFEPDTSEKCTYDVTVKCVLNETEICSDTASVSVQEQPSDKTENNSDELQGIDIQWFAPVLNDYYVYAGQESEISASAEINYVSDTDFTGSIEISVFNENKQIAVNKSDINIEKASLVSGGIYASYPVFISDSILSFNVKKSGSYDVTARLYDSEGIQINEGSTKLIVVDKPEQNLVLYSEEDKDKSNTVNLSWNEISSDAESYNYMLYRRADNGEWENRSIWNEEEHIKVINVYPARPYLYDWMNTTVSDSEEPAGMGIFDIESVFFGDFNSDPYSYLLNEDGSWKHDVMFLGAADNNSGFDLNENSYEAVQDFIDSGRGALFGHDTITTSPYHPQFCRFAEQAGLMLGHFQTLRTSSVSVLKIGTLTNYPWPIRGTLTIPVTHSSDQFIVQATNWITLNTPKYIYPDTGYTDGSYLSTYKNLGLIQTGDSTGQATDDERKIIANTLFYLYQTSRQTTAKDGSFVDIDAPDKPEIISETTTDGKMMLNLSSRDNATDYEYYISAVPDNEKSDTVLSNIKKHTVKSGLNGFAVEINDSSEKSPELIRYDENNEFILNIHKADDNGNAVINAVPEDFTKPQYVHIFAVDNANNISEEIIIPFAESELLTSVSTDKQIYADGEKAEINFEAVSTAFGRSADVSVKILDEFDEVIAEIYSENSLALNADDNLQKDCEWLIPSDAYGIYKAVITWTSEDIVLASDETKFKVKGNATVSNKVSTEKSDYTVNEPVSISELVFNTSDSLENDITLVVDVKSAGRNAFSTSFEHKLSMFDAKETKSCTDAILPNVLSEGKYIVTAVVKQGDIQISSSSCEFSVTEKSDSFKGTLDLDNDDKNASASFNVSNTGTDDADEVRISVKVYQDGIDKPVYEYSELHSVKSGETVSITENFNLPALSGTIYTGVLSAEYNGSVSDLDYDGITAYENVAVTEITQPDETQITSAETTVTSKNTKQTKSGNNKQTNSPGTGGRQIPGPVWAAFFLSIICFVILRITGEGEKENEKK